MSEPHLEDLPEAIPLHRVAPAWRALALLAFLVAGLMVLLVVVLGIVIAGLRAHLQAVSTYPPPAPMTAAFPATTTPVQPAVDPDEPVEAVNLPYPVRDDLRPAAQQMRPEEEEATLPRARFLKKGEEVWKSFPHQQIFSHAAISPDGQHIAYFQGENLIAGPLGNPQAVETRSNGENAGKKESAPKPERQLTGNPVWSADSRYVYYADAGARMYRYDVQNVSVETLPFRGQSPAPTPDNSGIVFVRSHPAAKVETPGAPAAADPVEIVLANLTNRKLRVVVPVGKAAWKDLVVSPDGKQLAAVSDRGHEGNNFIRWRLFVVGLADGKMQAVTPPASQVGPACWTADGKLLIYARSQQPMPPDCWANADNFYRSTDLFQYDLAAKKEMRLSRGGGFLSPSLGPEGSLYYLTAKRDNNFRNRPRVLKMVLAGAQRFGKTEPELPVRDAEAWTALLERVCKDVPANADGDVLNPETLRRIAEQFDQVYKEQFMEEPPATEAALDRLLRQELPSLSWDRAQRGRLVLVMGAVQGEFLRRKCGAEWQLVKGPLTGIDKPDVLDDSPFGYVFNPFRLPDGNSRLSLFYLQHQAEGRPLVLTNDPTAARALLAKRVDADLTRGTELLQQGMVEAGEKLLLDVLNREPNRGNLYLALRVGRLLYDHDRKDALRKLMERRCARPPRDARQFNLLGLALLDAAPDQAIAAFKKALRCDLQFGPAYLNLAQAYQKTGDTNSACLCLKRYLDLLPYGPLAGDAARRLAILRGPGGG